MATRIVLSGDALERERLDLSAKSNAELAECLQSRREDGKILSQKHLSFMVRCTRLGLREDVFPVITDNSKETEEIGEILKMPRQQVHQVRSALIQLGVLDPLHEPDIPDMRILAVVMRDGPCTLEHMAEILDARHILHSKIYRRAQRLQSEGKIKLCSIEFNRSRHGFRFFDCFREGVRPRTKYVIIAGDHLQERRLGEIYIDQLRTNASESALKGLSRRLPEQQLPIEVKKILRREIQGKLGIDVEAS